MSMLLFSFQLSLQCITNPEFGYFSKSKMCLMNIEIEIEMIFDGKGFKKFLCREIKENN